MKQSSVHDCHLISLPKISTTGGNITAINEQLEVPFGLSRVYYLYDVPGGESRGGHAHKDLHQMIVAACGSFSVVLDDGKQKVTHRLNRSYYGLLIVPGIWRELEDFSSGSICLVLASHSYDENDYLRDYNKFLKYRLSIT
jgi:hypothetical protein